MTMQSIREHYGIPAQRGMRIRFQGIPVEITGTTRSAEHLRVRAVDETGRAKWGRAPFPIHPTWAVVYPATGR